MPTKTFPCGHKGKGQYCHRCAQEKLNTEKQHAAKQEKLNWENSFLQDPIDLRSLPTRKLVEKARTIIQAVANGEAYQHFGGKRLNYDRNMISIPINHDYRLLYYHAENGIELQRLMNHEEYNVRKPGQKR